MRKWFSILAAAAIAVGMAPDVDAGCGCRSSGATVKLRFRVRERSRCQTAAPPVSGCAPCGQATAPSPASAPGDCPTCPAFGVTVDIAPQPTLFGRLLSLHNAERARRGLTTLRLDVTLCQGAQQAAQAQASRGSVGHFLPLAGASAENAARGQVSEEDAWFSWANSPGHLRNAIGPYTRVGFGMVQGPGGPYWAARFQ